LKNSVNLRLCGGTFFTLLLEARKQQYGARQHYNRQKDGLTEPETLLGLARAVVPDWPMPDASMMDTVKGNTTNYKLCKNKGGKTYFPFSDRAAIRTFDNRIKGQYGEALDAMWAFRDTFLEIKGSRKKDESLVRVLVELINEDDSIDAEQLFYISVDGMPVKKQDLIQKDRVCYEAFLLGVFHFAIMRKEPATIGAEAINLWCPSTGGGPREYHGRIGESWPEIKLDYYQPAGVPQHENDAADETEAGIVDAEPVSEQTEEGQPGAERPVAQQVVVNNNPTFFSQHGNNNIQVETIENLTINW
jgi:hypothetical protein